MCISSLAENYFFYKFFFCYLSAPRPEKIGETTNKIGKALGLIKHYVRLMVGTFCMFFTSFFPIMKTFGIQSDASQSTFGVHNKREACWLELYADGLTFLTLHADRLASTKFQGKTAKNIFFPPMTIPMCCVKNVKI